MVRRNTVYENGAVGTRAGLLPTTQYAEMRAANDAFFARVMPSIQPEDMPELEECFRSIPGRSRRGETLGTAFRQ